MVGPGLGRLLAEWRVRRDGADDLMFIDPAEFVRWRRELHPEVAPFRVYRTRPGSFDPLPGTATEHWSLESAAVRKGCLSFEDPVGVGATWTGVPGEAQQTLGALADVVHRYLTGWLTESPSEN